MKTNFGKIFTMVLATVLMFSVFSGCNTAESVNSGLNSSVEPTETPEPTGTTESTFGTETTAPDAETTPPNATVSSTETAKPTQTNTKPTASNAKPTESAGCSHQWSSWTVQKDTTCTENGSKTRKCNLCGIAQQETLASPGHNWDSGKITTTPTSCSDVGVKTFTCKTCGQKKVTQITGAHTFGDWKYEEYTYQYTSVSGKLKTQVSHRKVRYCTKCNYKETDGTKNHVCEIGADNHTTKVIKKGTCTNKEVIRSTCSVCGWYTDYEGEYGQCIVTKTTKHLTDCTQYTNEVDVTIWSCSYCGETEYTYDVGDGYERYRMSIDVNCEPGTAYIGSDASAYTDDRLIKHPTWQMVSRNQICDTQGYLIQWDYIWCDASGNRYSQTIKTKDVPAMFEAAGFNLSDYDGYTTVRFHFKVSGSKIIPSRISFT